MVVEEGEAGGSGSGRGRRGKNRAGIGIFEGWGGGRKEVVGEWKEGERVWKGMWREVMVTLGVGKRILWGISWWSCPPQGGKSVLAPDARVTQRNIVYWENQQLGIVCFVWVMIVSGEFCFVLET